MRQGKGWSLARCIKGKEHWVRGSSWRGGKGKHGLRETGPGKRGGRAGGGERDGGLRDDLKGRREREYKTNGNKEKIYTL